MKIKLFAPRKVPSLNTLFAMGHWQRRREKLATQDVVLLGLKALGRDSLTQITFALSGFLMPYDMLELYMTTDRKTSSTKSRKKKVKKKGRKSR